MKKTSSSVFSLLDLILFVSGFCFEDEVTRHMFVDSLPFALCHGKLLLF